MTMTDEENETRRVLVAQITETRAFPPLPLLHFAFYASPIQTKFSSYSSAIGHDRIDAQVSE